MRFDKATRPMEKSNIKTRATGRLINGPPDGRFMGARGFFLGLLLVAVSGTGSCGGIDDKLALQRKPHLKPHEWWSGRHQGRRIILDRNRNIMETAAVKRLCTAQDVTRGSCIETIEYHYASAGPKKVREENRLVWTIAYDDNTHMTVELKDGAGLVRGKVTGTVMLLEGDRRVPLQKDRSAAVRIRYDRLPGPGEPVLETRTFSMLGINIGTVETYWTRVTSP